MIKNTENSTPRTWGNTFLPKSKPPSRSLILVDTRGLSPQVRIALACLQGLTSREKPQIWLHMSNRDPQWLDWHREKGYIDGYNKVDDLPSLFHKFKNAYRGAIIPDPELYRGELLAANIASCENLIIATPELVQELNIPVIMDLRERFNTYADGMEWVWDNYRDQLNHHLCNFMHPDRLSNGAFAYDIQWKSILFWIVGKVDSAEAGSNMERETELVARIMGEMAPNVPVLGFPYAGEGVGPGEVNGVTLASKYAKPLVCTDSLANACVMSGIQIDRLEQKKLTPPPLEKDKIYIALNMSDGDNQNIWLAFYKPYFQNENYGKFPLAFGMGPPIMDLMPGVAQWYYENAAYNTEFFADVSGIGYIQPKNYALNYRERDEVFNGFLNWTDIYMEKMDMSTLRTVGGEDEILSRYAEKLPHLHSIFADMGRYSGREGIDNLTYMLGNMPIFRSVTSWRYGKDGFIRELHEQIGQKRPAFVNGFVHCWTFNSMEIITREIYDKRSDDMVFVTPRQLAELYKQARELGLVK
ncbi:hypothetical protein GF312_02415 [Candidatus Poribacteria bacterium]|nr:hypothetical protein [Candidatus Poribacteria bacterium]